MEQSEIIRMRQLIERVGLSRPSIYRLIAMDRFPRPIVLGLKAVGWRVEEVEAWLESRPRSKAATNVAPRDCR